MDLFAELKALIVQICAVDEDEVTPEVNLHADLGVDSLATWTLAVAVSERYGIELPAEDIVELDDVGELVALVEARING
jgi:acyl carrier protein